MPLVGRRAPRKDVVGKSVMKTQHCVEGAYVLPGYARQMARMLVADLRNILNIGGGGVGAHRPDRGRCDRCVRISHHARGSWPVDPCLYWLVDASMRQSQAFRPPSPTRLAARTRPLHRPTKSGRSAP